MPSTLSLVLTPHGSLRLDRVEDELPLADELAERLEKNFARGSGHGLLHLDAAEAGTSLPPGLAWWRDFAMRFVAELCSLGETARRSVLPARSASELAALVDEAPPLLANPLQTNSGRTALIFRGKLFRQPGPALG
jgi:hypothetical protein